MSVHRRLLFNHVGWDLRRRAYRTSGSGGAREGLRDMPVHEWEMCVEIQRKMER